MSSKEAKVAVQLTVTVKTKKLWDEFCEATPGNHDTRLAYLLGLVKKNKAL